MTLKPLELKNEIAVVTGVANGIGKGIVKALLEEEMKVVIQALHYKKLKILNTRLIISKFFH